MYQIKVRASQHWAFVFEDYRLLVQWDAVS